LEPSDESKPAVILIVEDEMIVRMSTTDILQDAGYHVLEARDGVEAIAVIELRDDVAAAAFAERRANLVRSQAAHEGGCLQCPQGVLPISRPAESGSVGRDALSIKCPVG
jgi:hypothetical protein